MEVGGQMMLVFWLVVVAQASDESACSLDDQIYRHTMEILWVQF